MVLKGGTPPPHGDRIHASSEKHEVRVAHAHGREQELLAREIIKIRSEKFGDEPLVVRHFLPDEGGILDSAHPNEPREKLGSAHFHFDAPINLERECVGPLRSLDDVSRLQQPEGLYKPDEAP